MQRCHGVMLLLKAFYQQYAPLIDTMEFGFVIKMVSLHLQLPTVMYVISCKAEGKACQSTNCYCVQKHLSCTIDCNCKSEEKFLKPLTRCDNYEDASEDESEEEVHFKEVAQMMLTTTNKPQRCKFMRQLILSREP